MATSSLGSATPATASSAPSSRAVLPGSSEALHQDGELERAFGDRRRRQCLSGGGGLVRHSAAIEQRAGVFDIDREIDVFGDRPGPFDDAQTIKLGDDNSGDGAARVENWAAAVAGLHGCGYLQLIRVVTRPRQSADDPRGNARLRAQYTLERKADDDH